MKPFYITTPIYYVTDAPHIGHLYTSLAADIMSRYHRLKGDNVWFLTGTDEHGQKIQKKAKENNETPQELADRVVERYRKAWTRYEITYNDFIRTTEERHKTVVVSFVDKLMKSGDIYLGGYEGWYCIPDEAYWTEAQLKDGKCPDCGRPVEWLTEESYFFKMSAYEKRLLEHIEKNPGFIQPESRKNEVLGFIRQGLRDISVSRTTITWGIPMPKDPKATKEHKIYVWFDALSNYVSALGYPNDSKYTTFWPEAIHIVGKDILRFHAVYWPTFLMALGLPLPKRIVAHGWLTDGARKISKSLGNVVDPFALADTYGVDGVRYFLFREFVFGLDGEYTQDLVYARINADLANDYGNCVSRTCSMIIKYLGTSPVEISKALSAHSELKRVAQAAVAAVDGEMEQFAYHKALENLWRAVGEANRHIESNAPWTLAKSQKPEDRERLIEVLVHCREALRMVSVILLAFIPESARKALDTLGGALPDGLAAPVQFAQWGAAGSTMLVKTPTPLFPRLEVPKTK
ncbi:MAG: methionine--tRNA ligase [Deltaproteobacteria bacterium]|nr:methionine--tRNA ligase [Deltaproteobacteria bacterium]MBI3295987.1 methionine--tRNA ligase [Deltaproteobacteria bacterium]